MPYLSGSVPEPALAAADPVPLACVNPKEGNAKSAAITSGRMRAFITPPVCYGQTMPGA